MCTHGAREFNSFLLFVMFLLYCTLSAHNIVIVDIRLPKGMAFILFLSLFIVKDKQHLRPRPKFSLSFAMKRDKKGIKAILFGSLVDIT
jgi:hypothetical protein